MTSCIMSLDNLPYMVKTPGLFLSNIQLITMIHTTQTQPRSEHKGADYNQKAPAQHDPAEPTTCTATPK